jgi:hypothetical protein
MDELEYGSSVGKGNGFLSSRFMGVSGKSITGDVGIEVMPTLRMSGGGGIELAGGSPPFSLMWEVVSSPLE